MPKIEIYTKFMCAYCARAIALLTRKGAAFDEHDITMGGPDRAVMLERSGGRTTSSEGAPASGAPGSTAFVSLAIGRLWGAVYRKQ